MEAGADEVDMVIDRSAFLTGDYRTVFDEIVDVKEACGEAHLKVILETGELETYDNVRRASVLAMAAGADFIKTSTGKVQPAATLPVTLVMLEAIRDFERATGRQVGMKPAGGIRVAKEAIQYLVVLYETLGPRWMSPDWFRFGASSLLNDVLMQIEFQRSGRYRTPTTSRSTEGAGRDAPVRLGRGIPRCLWVVPRSARAGASADPRHPRRCAARRRLPDDGALVARDGGRPSRRHRDLDPAVEREPVRGGRRPGDRAIADALAGEDLGGVNGPPSTPRPSPGPGAGGRAATYVRECASAVTPSRR